MRAQQLLDLAMSPHAWGRGLSASLVCACSCWFLAQPLHAQSAAGAADGGGEVQADASEVPAEPSDAGVPLEPAPPAPSLSVPPRAAPVPPDPAATQPIDETQPLDDQGVPSYGASAVAPGPLVSVDIADTPRNVQHVSGDAIARQHGVGLNEALNARLGSATINDVQNNPLQPDFQFRGFTASPLLGTPQGIAVYQNGVRINEPFGDVLQWDVIPTFAIAGATLVPGANPVYGLNALGGSLVLQMKNGWSAPGLRIEGLAGSFGRYLTTAEFGHAWGPWAVYAGGSLFGEQGFRDRSPSEARTLYLDARHRVRGREVGVSGTLSSTRLFGNGPAPTELLHEDRSALYTWPDITRNQLVMLSVDAKQRIAKNAALLGTIYVRHGHRSTLNGDEAEFDQCPQDDGRTLLCEESGEILRDESDYPIAVDEPYDALYNTTSTASDGLGATLQLDLREPLLSKPNQFALGASYDGSRNAFLQRSEVGRLTIDRTVQGSGLHLSGDEYRTDLEVQNHAVGVFATETWRVAAPLALQVSARLNVYDTKLDDLQGEALDGHHTFTRVNPAAGVTYDVIDALTLFASYGESNRAPSAAELSCADPDEPCRVPNSFISDPPLRQVVSRSVELGLRTRAGDRARPWLEGSLAVFGTRNQDDILFVAGSRVGTGYFRNSGATQRIGLEASLAIERGSLRAYASYTLLRATFESELELPGTANPFATGSDGDDDGRVLEVEKGSRIPGLPTHSVKAGAAVRILPPLEIGLSMSGQSSQPFRGDEANRLGGVGGYVVLNAHASYEVFEQLELFVRAQNLLDTQYSTFGVLADPSEVLRGMSNPRFLGPGAPLGVWVGAVVRN